MDEGFNSLENRTCKFCNHVTPMHKSYVYLRDKIQTHNRACLKQQKFKCSDCGEIFSEKKDLIVHMEYIHDKKRRYFDYKCPDCDMSFTKYGSMANHVKKVYFIICWKHSWNGSSSIIKAGPAHFLNYWGGDANIGGAKDIKWPESLDVWVIFLGK